ncbi:zinc finger protein 546-like isoform X2 [Ochlerotatus camptorhynchus]|uniref:zinc finger protein 546-like isoform X2 n=1 Tax=Ochlerotatus camptorhynchus TaxID=644619 RepID=UPI0031DAC042
MQKIHKRIFVKSRSSTWFIINCYLLKCNRSFIRMDSIFSAGFSDGLSEISTMLNSHDFPACCRLCLKPSRDDPLDVIQCEQIHPESGFSVHDLLLEMSFEPSVGSICQACYCELQNVYRFRSQSTEMYKFYKVLVEAKISGNEEPLVELIERKTSDKLRSHLVRLGIISTDKLFMKSYLAETGFVASVTEPVGDIFKPQIISVKLENETETDYSNSEDNVEPPAKVSRKQTRQEPKDLDRPKAKRPEKFTVCPISDCRESLQAQTYVTHLRDYHKYGCKLCGIILKSRHVMAQHVVVHKDRPLTVQCTFCDQKFSSFGTMRAHAKMVHEKLATSYKCKECGDIFDRRKPFTEHIKSHLPKECTICGDDFDHHIRLYYHMKNHHPAKLLRCTYCFREFLIQSALDHHMEQSSVNPNHISDESYEVLTLKSMMMFSCLECDKQFTSEAHRSTHMDSHVFKMRHIPVKTRRPKEELDKLEYKFQCDQCDAKYRLQRSLDSHRRKHKLPPLVCDSCGAVFENKTYLKHHIIYKHTKDFRHICDFCKKAFATSSDLLRHRRIHTKECPYQCSQCGDRFITNNAYNRHVRINAGLEVHRSTYRRKRSIHQSRDEGRAADVEIEQLNT